MKIAGLLMTVAALVVVTDLGLAVSRASGQEPDKAPGNPLAGIKMRFSPKQTPEPKISGDAIVNLSISPRGKLILVQPDFDGVKGTFILDTGAASTVATEAFAQKSRIHMARLSVPTIVNGRRQKGEFYITDGFSFNESTVFSDFDLMRSDLSHLSETLKVKLDGIMGSNVLATAPYTLDYSNRSLTFRLPDNLSDYTEIPIQFRQDCRPVLDVAVNGKRLSFVLDSGASKSFIVPSEFDGESRVAGGEVEADLFDVKKTGTDTYAILESCVIGGLELNGLKPKLSGDENLLGIDFLENHVVAVDAAKKTMYVRQTP